MPGALQTYKFRDVFKVLSEHELVPARDDRHVAYAELEQALAAAGVVQHVDRYKINFLFRKKLFRSKAAASPRLGEIHELVG